MFYFAYYWLRTAMPGLSYLPSSPERIQFLLCGTSMLTEGDMLTSKGTIGSASVFLRPSSLFLIKLGGKTRK